MPMAARSAASTSPASAPPAPPCSKMASSATTRNPAPARDIKPVENSVDEVKVLTGTLPAEYGHSTGGVVTVVKKSGTNSLHGYGFRPGPHAHA